jgi:hypothetical protein
MKLRHPAYTIFIPYGHVYSLQSRKMNAVCQIMMYKGEKPR